MEKRTHMIDRTSPLPAYHQIANDIIGRIAQSEWSVDDRLPSEAELAAEYGVSRVTLRQAMSQLEKENIIKKYQGKGAFVKNNPRQLIQNLVFPSLENPATNPNPVQSRIIRLTQFKNPDHLAKVGLNLTGDETLTYIQRIFLHNEKPIGINNIWFKASDVPDLSADSLIDGSVSKTLKISYHYEITAIENYIESVRLDAATASLLNTVYDSLGLKIDSQYLLSNGQPIEYSSTIWLGDFTRFHYRVSK